MDRIKKWRQMPQQQLLALSKTQEDSQNVLTIIDKFLNHLNHISKTNLIFQEIYIELLKQKNIMKFDQIKKIYKTLTEGKAKQILFENDKKQLIQTDYQNHESLIRLCWRSIQKLVKKITFYMINENYLSVISKSVLKLIHLNQQFLGKFNKFKSSSMLFIVQIMEKFIEQNSILQNKIYDILLNRGYISSMDQFYRLNGIDADHRQNYYAKKVGDNQVEQNWSNKQRNYQKLLTQKSVKGAIRKKKGKKLDLRYSWMQNHQIEQKVDNQKYSTSKTNYLIRQSFQKLIGDFLENQNVNQVLNQFQFQDSIKKQITLVNANQETIIHKKIFQKKIQPVIHQLKINGVKASSKLLQIIQKSSNQALTSNAKHEQREQNYKKTKSPKQKIVATELKLKDSYIVNHRKIINQSFFKEILKKYTNAQNSVNQEINNQTNNWERKFEITDLTKSSFKINEGQISEKNHNQNNSIIIKKFKFLHPKEPSGLQKGKTKTLSNNLKSNAFKPMKSQTKYIKSKLQQCKYLIDNKKMLTNMNYAQSIQKRIKTLKEQWQIANNHHILKGIENSSISNDPVKIAEIFDCFQTNSKQHYSRNIEEDQDKLFNIINFKKRFQTDIYQTVNPDLKIKSINQISHIKRFNTEKISKKSLIKHSQRSFFQRDKENKHYDVFDRRRRRIMIS